MVYEELIWKIIIAGLFALIAVLIKPWKKKISIFFKKLLGTAKYSVTVSGHVREKYSRTGYLQTFEITLPLKSIHEEDMSIKESDRLIIEGINKKYGKMYDLISYDLNNIRVKRNVS